MSGAYLENLDHVYPGLNTILGESKALRGTVPHIIEKTRKIKKTEGIHHLSVDQLLVMTAYWAALSEKYDARAKDDIGLNFWHADRISVYTTELHRRELEKTQPSDHDKFIEVIRLLFSDQSRTTQIT